MDHILVPHLSRFSPLLIAEVQDCWSPHSRWALQGAWLWQWMDRNGMQEQFWGKNVNIHQGEEVLASILLLLFLIRDGKMRVFERSVPSSCLGKFDRLFSSRWHHHQRGIPSLRHARCEHRQRLGTHGCRSGRVADAALPTAAALELPWLGCFEGSWVNLWGLCGYWWGFV